MRSLRDASLLLLLFLPPLPSPYPLSPRGAPLGAYQFPALSCFSCLAAVLCFVACSAWRCFFFCLPGFGFPCVFSPSLQPFLSFVLAACGVLPLPVLCLCCFPLFPYCWLWLAVLVPSFLPSPRLCVCVKPQTKPGIFAWICFI